MTFEEMIVDIKVWPYRKVYKAGENWTKVASVKIELPLQFVLDKIQLIVSNDKTKYFLGWPQWGDKAKKNFFPYCITYNREVKDKLAGLAFEKYHEALKIQEEKANAPTAEKQFAKAQAETEDVEGF